MLKVTCNRLIEMCAYEVSIFYRCTQTNDLKSVALKYYNKKIISTLLQKSI